MSNALFRACCAAHLSVGDHLGQAILLSISRFSFNSLAVMSTLDNLPFIFSQLLYHIILYLIKKGNLSVPLELISWPILHKVCNLYTSVVLVDVRCKRLSIRCAVSLNNEWVSNHSVTCLKSNLGLEGVWTYWSDHL